MKDINKCGIEKVNHLKPGLCCYNSRQHNRFDLSSNYSSCYFTFFLTEVVGGKKVPARRPQQVKSKKSFHMRSIHTRLAAPHFRQASGVGKQSTP